MLTRKTPLKRSGFKSKRYHAPSVEREPKPMARPLDKPANYAGGTSGRAVGKRPAIRSAKLLAVVRTLPCQLTGLVGQTEAAHSNWPQHGKSGARKADDNRVAALSSSVHRELDQGSRWSAQDRQRIWWDCHRRTVNLLLSSGQWPAGVPVPQLEDFWKP